MSNSFCTNCGAAINPGVKFCGKCGNQVVSSSAPIVQQHYSEPVQSNAAPSPAVQNYRYIVPAQYKKGILSHKACSLIISDTEIIVALVDNKLMNQHVAAVKEDAKNEKFLKRTAAVMKAGYTYSDKYWYMNPGQIIEELPGNFIIGNNTVNSIRYHKGTTTYNGDTNTSTPPSLTLKGTGGKTIFIFNSSIDNKAFIGTLQAVYGTRYKGPKR